MKKRIILWTLVVGMGVSLVGCGQASKQEIIESDYYQELQDKYDKAKKDLKASENRESELNEKIKEIHEETGDQKLAAYKKKVANSVVSKIRFTQMDGKQEGESFSVTNQPICKYVKEMVANSYRIIGLTTNDLTKTYKSSSYSYAIIDEDNTTYEFRIYGNSYIIFDSIPENVYCYNDAAALGAGLIDATTKKTYNSIFDKIADADVIVSDSYLGFADDALRVGNQLYRIKDSIVTGGNYDTSTFKEYRFYTRGSVSTLYLGDDNIVCLENKKGDKKYYKATDKIFKNLTKLLK